MTQVIYAFSGDPITFGHIDVVERAARLFDNVLVAIGTNPAKTCTFTLNQREQMSSHP